MAAFDYSIVAELFPTRSEIKSVPSRRRHRRASPLGYGRFDTAQEKPQQGKVIAVGPGGRDESGKLIPIDVKVGNPILFGKWPGTEVKIDGVEYLIMKESDIMGVLVEADAKKDVKKRAA